MGIRVEATYKTRNSTIGTEEGIARPLVLKRIAQYGCLLSAVVITCASLCTTATPTTQSLDRYNENKVESDGRLSIFLIAAC